MSEKQAIGVLVNARAGRAQRDPGLTARLQRHLPAGRVQATAWPDQIAPALTELRAAGVDRLLLVGGDGTISCVLSALESVWPPADWPALVLCRGGTINTIARAMGAETSPVGTLIRLLHDWEPTETLRPALHVQPDHGPAVRGVIFGNGVATRWLEAYYATGETGVATARRLVGRAVASAALGGPLAEQLFSSFEAELEVDGEVVRKGPFTVIGASTVQHVGLGFRPFHTAGSDPERFHLLHTDANPARFILELPGALFGRALSAGSIRDHSAQRARIRTAEPATWMVDAEVQPPCQQLDLSLSPPVRFWTF